MANSQRGPVSKAELTAFLKKHPKWRVEGGHLVRDFENPSFPDAMRFVNEVAQLAEATDHHPDIDIRYKAVRLSFSTHDAGDTITGRDVSLAAECDLCFEAHRAQPHASAPRKR